VSYKHLLFVLAPAFSRRSSQNRRDWCCRSPKKLGLTLYLLERKTRACSFPEPSTEPLSFFFSYRTALGPTDRWTDWCAVSRTQPTGWEGYRRETTKTPTGSRDFHNNRRSFMFFGSEFSPLTLKLRQPLTGHDWLGHKVGPIGVWRVGFDFSFFNSCWNIFLFLPLTIPKLSTKPISSISYRTWPAPTDRWTGWCAATWDSTFLFFFFFFFILNNLFYN